MIKNEKLLEIVNGFRANKTELEHVEFKHNWHSEEELALDIVAISNTLIRRSINRGYIIFGIDDKTHSIVGTDFHYQQKKIKGTEIELCVQVNIHPKPNIEFTSIKVDGKWLTVIIISPQSEIMEYQNFEYIRIGTNTKKLKEFPSIRRELWNKVLAIDFEDVIIASNLSKSKVFDLLDTKAFIDMRKQAGISISEHQLLEELINSGFVTDNSDSTYNITNLGAYMFAKSISDFSSLEQKVPRVIVYNGSNKLDTKQDYRSKKGAANGFSLVLDVILDSIRIGESIGDDGIRRINYAFPQIALRELLANCIIHQDFSENGKQILIEIYDDRITFINPGVPLVKPMLFLGSPPVSRNETLAAQMYKLGICEQKGSGWQKIASSLDNDGFISPHSIVADGYTTITLRRRLPQNKLTKEEQALAVYYHTCVQYRDDQYTNNQSIRERFGLAKSSASVASKLINLAIEKGYIKHFDEKVGNKSMQYVPFWAGESIG
ncbi:MAG: putative DNA binding domain-containing protein [Candidatus Ancillula sp.]|jgi:predicted HTH transcriptional regulator|nr:putative DNA binding domain-containing protein [Candidatus Ancillula sp.]